MIKQLCCIFSLCFTLLGLSYGAPTAAQTMLDMDNLDTILEDNGFNDFANRYTSVLLSLFPERATRLGFTSANGKLDERTPEHQAQALEVLQSVRSQLANINEKNLSAAKQADLQLLRKDMDYTIWLLEQNRIETSPLYYAEALDAVYDVRLKQTTSPTQQRLDIAARLKALTQVVEQAEKNLTQAPPFQSYLAMEKAYYAFLAMDDLTEFLVQTAPDADIAAVIRKESLEAKRSIKRLFDLFKKLSKEENSFDFRLGEEKYWFLLGNKYQIKQKPEKFYAQIQKNLLQAQEGLTKALDPFMLSAETEEVTLVDEGNLDEARPLPPVKKPAKKSRKKQAAQPLRNAQDFYAIVKQMDDVALPEDPLGALKEDVAQAVSFFSQSGILPGKTFAFKPKAMPLYEAYSYADLLVLPYGNQPVEFADFFLRLPAGNQLTKQEQLNRDFNSPTRKWMLSGEIIPGRYYQTMLSGNLSLVRRLYPSILLTNGWSAYAQKLALETKFLLTDEELLFAAWNTYLRALAAWVDVKLNTRQLTYAEVIDQLTLEHGLEQRQAEELVKKVVAAPGEALSYQAGLELIQNLRNKYQKKQGKKFNQADFHAHLLQIGNITPEYLEQELNAFYE